MAVMFKLAIDSSNTTDKIVTLVLHSKSRRPIPFFSEPGSVDIKVNETSFLSVLVDITTILTSPAPESVCADYRTLNYRSYDDCIFKCKLTGGSVLSYLITR